MQHLAVRWLFDGNNTGCLTWCSNSAFSGLSLQRWTPCHQPITRRIIFAVRTWCYILRASTIVVTHLLVPWSLRIQLSLVLITFAFNPEMNPITYPSTRKTFLLLLNFSRPKHSDSYWSSTGPVRFLLVVFPLSWTQPTSHAPYFLQASLWLVLLATALQGMSKTICRLALLACPAFAPVCLKKTQKSYCLFSRLLRIGITNSIFVYVVSQGGIRVLHPQQSRQISASLLNSFYWEDLFDLYNQSYFKATESHYDFHQQHSIRDRPRFLCSIFAAVSCGNPA